MMRGTGSRDRGAAAVEFALVVPLLLAVLLGIVDYGLWFGDSLNLRQGVREGAREAVVQAFRSPSCSAAGRDLANAACRTNERIGGFTGRTYVKIKSTKVNGSPGWERGGQVLVCGLLAADGLTGFTPMPKSGVIRSAVVMRIEEQSQPVSGGYSATYGGSLPAGVSWSGDCA